MLPTRWCLPSMRGQVCSACGRSLSALQVKRQRRRSYTPVGIWVLPVLGAAVLTSLKLQALRGARRLNLRRMLPLVARFYLHMQPVKLTALAIWFGFLAAAAVFCARLALQPGIGVTGLERSPRYGQIVTLIPGKQSAVVLGVDDHSVSVIVADATGGVKTQVVARAAVNFSQVPLWR